MRKKGTRPAAPTQTQPQARKNFIIIILQHLQGRNYRPSTTKELAQRLAILPEQMPSFEHTLYALKEKGTISQTSSERWIGSNESSRDYQEGVISFHPRGFAFVRLVNDAANGDVFIPPSQTLNALPSDHVLIEITGQDRKGPEGRVVHILERSQNSLFGVITEIGEQQAYAYVPSMAQQRVVINLEPGEQVVAGERVILKVQKWENKEHQINCTIVEKLGSIEDPSLDTEIAIEEFGLRRDFPAKVLDEALTMGSRVKTKEIQSREDLREAITLTIDPDTAKDFDDAITIEKTQSGYTLSVHIADVAHYVKYGSQLDEEARKRSNSTYFPGYCLPMLPSELSNELCSLKPNVNRLTVSVIIDFDAAGSMYKHRICRSVIRSSKRLTYRQALDILEGRLKSPFKAQLDLMLELCNKLKSHKAARGSVEFSLPEAAVICNSQGQPERIDYVEYDITHQMIEEFMVKANEVVAMHLSKAGKDLIFRVHEAPALEDLREFFQVARNFGHQFAGQPTPQQWQQFFRSIQGAPYAPQLASSYIRSMKMAQYSTGNIGHYGLSLEYYCHFTSPIRRYSDLTVIRALFDERRHTSEELEKIALNCSDTERQSAKAEQSVNQLKKLRLLKSQLKADSQHAFGAIVTKVKAFGLTFDLSQFLFEGFIHISQLSDDYFIFDEENQVLRGRSSGLTLRPGDNIQVQLLDVDLIYRECKWQLHEALVGPSIRFEGSRSQRSRSSRDKKPARKGHSSHGSSSSFQPRKPRQSAKPSRGSKNPKRRHH